MLGITDVGGGFVWVGRGLVLVQADLIIMMTGVCMWCHIGLGWPHLILAWYVIACWQIAGVGCPVPLLMLCLPRWDYPAVCAASASGSQG